MRYDELVRDDRIHASLYTDPAIFADEMERIFHRGWVFVGHASEIPGPGDFVTRTIGKQPAIMVRTTDGDVTVLMNRCMHRGTMVCAAEKGTTRTLPVSRLDVRRRRRAHRGAVPGRSPRRPCTRCTGGSGGRRIGYDEGMASFACA